MFNSNKHCKTEHNPKSTIIFWQEQILVILFTFLNFSFIFLLNFSYWSLKESERGSRVKSNYGISMHRRFSHDKMKVKSFRQEQNDFLLPFFSFKF